MEFFTKTDISVPDWQIDYTGKVAFIGSCFADNISRRFTERKFHVLSNPFGTIYNPLSIAAMLKNIADAKTYGEGDVFQDARAPLWLCWGAHGSLSAPTCEGCVANLNDAVTRARAFLQGSDAVFVTLGTAFVYFLKQTGEVVSNCHRQDPSLFTRELVSVERAVAALRDIVDSLHKIRHGKVHVVFTVSPLRHVGDGMHNNTLSKATLQLAVNQVVAEFASGRSENFSDEVCVEYFPSYEIVMDELRDYRFYDADMVHLSETAEEYIFERMAETYCDATTRENIRKVEKFLKSAHHRISDASASAAVEFAKKCLAQVAELESQIPGLDLVEERERFMAP